jgi:7-cyano-7-deazaguanine synthase
MFPRLETFDPPRSQAVVLLSGGIDSTTALALARHYGFDCHALIFDYGQRLARELDYAERNAQRHATVSTVVRAPMNWIDPACSLLGAAPLQTGRSTSEIADSGPPTSYVPFRNGIMFAYAVAYGEARGIETIFGGCNGLQSGNYPDDTAEFGKAFTQAAQIGTQPGYQPRIWLPFATMPKAQIVGLGRRLGVDYTATWSCYDNGDRHCGRCDSCAQRRAAFTPNDLDLEGNPIA